MDKNRKKRILNTSILSGLFSFIILYLLKDILEIPFEYTIMFPLIYAIALWVVMPFVIQFEKRKYIGFEKKFTNKAIYMTDGVLMLEKGFLNGRLYVFPGKLIFYSAEVKPNIDLEIFGIDIRYIQLLDDLELAIILESDDPIEKKIRFRLVEAKMLMDNVKREVWLQKSVGL
ncbi:MAG: hypothetical protein FD141_1035 [Fusobacteria bacterium]|nr:MAG: hypothetical protein FD141_1035 [Fusobacteriota bacterium]KAF0229748.1 MAG: hypothetical protein FD182_138 [Fusobacteriota bacterium]